MSPISAVVDTMKAMSEEILSLREQVAALESREVCTVAHENVETCGYCQRDALTAESAALRDERALIIQRAENAEAALVEAAKDAERYRWLRDSAGNDIMEKLMAECSPPRWDELVDAAIDAAMGEKP